KDGNKNLLQSNAWDQRQQIKPRRDIKNHRVRDKIYCEDSIENGGHLFLLPSRSPIFNSQSSTNRSQLLFTVAGHSLLCSRSWNTICFDHSGQKFGITKCLLNHSLCIFVDLLGVCDQQARVCATETKSTLHRQQVVARPHSRLGWPLHAEQFLRQLLRINRVNERHVGLGLCTR